MSDGIDTASVVGVRGMCVTRRTLVREALPLALSALAVLGAQGLVGCARRSAPATTEALLLRYAALDDFDNFHADITCDTTLRGTGWRTRVPIAASCACAKGALHGTITCDLSALDSPDCVIEVFAVTKDLLVDCYLGMGEGEGRTWKLWRLDLSAPIDIITVTRLLSASELTVIARDSDPLVRYELTVPTRAVLETVFDLTGDVSELDLDDFEGDRVRVGFTEDCHLRSIITSSRFGIASEGQARDFEVDLDLDAVLDDYGQIDARDLEVTDDIRNAARPTEVPVELSEVVSKESPLYSVLVPDGKA